VIQVYLEDDSIQVMEPPQRNSGHKGGVFLARDRFENKDTNQYFTPPDIFVGASLAVMAHRFRIIDADEFSLKYMESNSELWATSDIKKIMGRLKSRKDVITRMILTVPGLSSKSVGVDELERVFLRSGTSLVRQEIVTLFRHLDPLKTKQVKLTKVRSF
jgi:EF-hand domain-containing protein 1